jgi:hypothetical protein
MMMVVVWGCAFFVAGAGETMFVFFDVTASSASSASTPLHHRPSQLTAAAQLANCYHHMPTKVSLFRLRRLFCRTRPPGVLNEEDLHFRNIQSKPFVGDLHTFRIGALVVPEIMLCSNSVRLHLRKSSCPLTLAPALSQ